MKHLISISDLTIDEIRQIFTIAAKLKKKCGKNYKPLSGKVLGMIFQKPSTRTRVSFEVGMFHLGGDVIFLDSQNMQLKRGESIKDTAKSLSRYLDGIVIRAYSHRDVLELARQSTISVINGLSDLLHPCQVLSDIFTIMEKKRISSLKKLMNVKIAFVGDGNNVANSWMEAGSKIGMNVVVCTPEGYEPDSDILKRCLEAQERTGGKIEISHVPEDAVKDADVIYTDVWTSMGDEKEEETRKKVFSSYAVTSPLVSRAKDGVIVMHCLPAHRGLEIADDVIDGPRSVVFDQAENRLHVQKAIMLLLMK